MSSGLRVLHLIPSLDADTGGPARSLPALCRALSTAGLEVELYTFRRPGARVAVGLTENFLIRWFLPMPGTRQLPTPSYYRSLRGETRRFDLVHLHSLWNPAVSLAALACRETGTPYLISPRGMLQSGALSRRKRLKSAYYAMIERRTIAGARALHFFTKAEAADSSHLVAAGTSIAIVPSGIDATLARGLAPGRFRQCYPELAGKRLVLFLGRLHWSKNLELQAGAMALLVGHFPDLVWVLAGPDGGAWADLSRLIRELRLGSHVLWTGLLPNEQCVQALADADVFLLTSRHEAHSAAMNEALAVGVPIVLTKSVQFDEVARFGAGLEVASEPQAIAAAVARILRDSELARNMSRAGRSLVCAQLAWPGVSEKMIELYRTIARATALRGTTEL